MRSSSRILKVNCVERKAVTVGPVCLKPAAGPLVSHEHILAEAQRQAQLMLDDAQEVAANTIAAAQARAKTVIAEAHQQGYQAGYADGKDAATREMFEHIQTLASIAERAATDTTELYRSREADMVELIVDIAQKVVRKAIALDRSAVLETVEAALDRCASQQIMRIRVSPGDFELVQRYWTERTASSDDAHGSEIVPDKRVQPGGCVIDTKGGTVDAQVETQLSEIRRAFEAVQGLE